MTLEEAKEKVIGESPNRIFGDMLAGWLKIEPAAVAMVEKKSAREAWEKIESYARKNKKGNKAAVDGVKAMEIAMEFYGEQEAAKKAERVMWMMCMEHFEPEQEKTLLANGAAMGASEKSADELDLDTMLAEASEK